eukprot:gene23828-biopygen19364
MTPSQRSICARCCARVDVKFACIRDSQSDMTQTVPKTGDHVNESVRHQPGVDCWLGSLPPVLLSKAGGGGLQAEKYTPGFGIPPW